MSVYLPISRPASSHRGKRGFQSYTSQKGSLEDEEIPQPWERFPGHPLLDTLSLPGHPGPDCCPSSNTVQVQWGALTSTMPCSPLDLLSQHQLHKQVQFHLPNHFIDKHFVK